MTRKSLRRIVPAVFGLALTPAAVRADFYPPTTIPPFVYNQNDTGSAPAVLPGSIQLLNGADEERSIFDNTPQSCTAGFTASFTFQLTGGGGPFGPTGWGFAFVLQNSSNGANAVGPEAGTSGLGYAAITPSINVTFDENSATGLFTDGNFNSSSEVSTSPVSLTSGDPINVTLTYDGSNVVESLFDTTTSGSFSHTYLIGNIPSIVGGSTAYVGITADSYYAADLTITKVPEPASFGLLGVGAIAALLRRRRPIHRRA